MWKFRHKPFQCDSRYNKPQDTKLPDNTNKKNWYSFVFIFSGKPCMTCSVTASLRLVEMRFVDAEVFPRSAALDRHLFAACMASVIHRFRLQTNKNGRNHQLQSGHSTKYIFEQCTHLPHWSPLHQPPQSATTALRVAARIGTSVCTSSFCSAPGTERKRCHTYLHEIEDLSGPLQRLPVEGVVGNHLVETIHTWHLLVVINNACGFADFLHNTSTTLSSGDRGCGGIVLGGNSLDHPLVLPGPLSQGTTMSPALILPA